MSRRRQVLLFLGLAYGFSYALQGLIWILGGVAGPSFAALAAVAMYTPAIAALVVLGRSDGLGSLAWTRPSVKWLAGALLIPMGAAFGCVALLSRIGLASPTRLRVVGGQVVTQGGPFLLDTGSQAVPWFALNAVLSGCVLAAVASLLTLGEEIGWRGFLQPRLVERFGVGRGVLLLGILWAHWHTPVILMGYNYPENPVLGALVLFPLTTIGVSFLCAGLTIPARSLWPAVLAHASFNLYFGGLVDTMRFTAGRWRADAIVALVLLALGLAVRAVTIRSPARPRYLTASLLDT